MIKQAREQKNSKRIPMFCNMWPNLLNLLQIILTAFGHQNPKVSQQFINPVLSRENIKLITTRHKVQFIIRVFLLKSTSIS